jgi:parallel beta-helix repeat protein
MSAPVFETSSLQLVLREDSIASGNVGASDPDGGPLVYRLAGAGPQNGTVDFDAASGTFTYTPRSDYHGDDAFVIEVEDTDGGTALLPVTLTILPENLRQVAVSEDAGLTALETDFLDPSAQVVLVTTGTVGAVELRNGNVLGYSPNGGFEALGAAGTAIDRFSVLVTHEGITQQYDFEVTINGANDAPVAVGEVPMQFAQSGYLWSYTVPQGLFADAEGDALSYFAYQGFDGALPDWLTFDAATLTYSGIVPDDPALLAQPLDLKLQAFDGSLAGGLRFDVIISDNPYLNRLPEDYLGVEDQFVSIQLPADLFIPAPGSLLTYAVTRASGDPLDAWLTFDPGTLTISGQPPADYNGRFNVRITASDGDGQSSVVFRLNLAEVDDTPSGVALSTPWITEYARPGMTVGFLTAIDPDIGDSFTYSLVNDRGGIFSIEDNRLIVSGFVDSHISNELQTDIKVTDAAGNAAITSFDINVRAAAAGDMFAAIAAPGQIWVATTGDDHAGDGSAANPFGSIQHAIDLAQPGTVIKVRGGTYQEALTLRKSGLPDAPIKLVSADGIGAAEIKPVGNAEVHAITGQAVQNWTISGFAITGTDTIGTYGINLVGRNNGAKSSIEDGFASELTANLVLQDNIITNWGIDGIHLGYVFNVEIIGNTVSGAHEQGIDIVYGNRLVIANNEISAITRKPEWFGLDQRDYIGDAGIVVKAGSIDVQILNNVITDTRGYGIKIGSSSGLQVIPIEWGLDDDGAHYVSYEAKHVAVRGNTVLSSANGAIDIFAAENVSVSENLLTTIRIGGYERALNAITYGGGEQYLPLGLKVFSDTIRIADNVTTAPQNFRNSPPSAHITETGTRGFDPGADYAVDDLAFALGSQADWHAYLKVIDGSGRNDRINGTAGADRINGRFGADIMTGGAGNDIYVFDQRADMAIETENGGIDTVILTRGALRYVLPEPAKDASGYIENAFAGSLGNFSIIENTLDNELRGGSGNDQLVGNLGDDKIFGGAGNDSLNGGDGRDFLYGQAGDDQLVGSTGDDVLEGGAGRDKLLGGAGNDMLISYDADFRISGGAGIDTAYLDRSTFGTGQAIVLDISIFGNGSAANDDPSEQVLSDGTRLQNIERLAISAGAGNDQLTGGFFDDQISSGDGNDFVAGFDGDDMLWGGLGNDHLSGGAGNDKIDGGPGSDFIEGGEGDDTIISQETDLVLLGGAGIDTLRVDRDGTNTSYVLKGAAIEGNTELRYQLGDGTLVGGFEVFDFTGGNGNDVLSGGSRDDRLSGGQGSDTIRGGIGTDRISGGAGIDFLYGDTGGDIINGGGAADHIWGGAGRDTFTYIAGQTQGDTIYDFEGAGKAGGDLLRFTGYGPGATLTYNAAGDIWTVASADGTLSEQLQILNVTQLIAADYTLL